MISEAIVSGPPDRLRTPALPFVSVSLFGPADFGARRGGSCTVLSITEIKTKTGQKQAEGNHFAETAKRS
jgi:hypothetical protein